MLLPVKVDSKQGLIQWNFEELKKTLTSQLKKFDGLVVVEEDIAEYEAIRAKLNKVKKLIDDERKKVKKEYSEPLSKFEGEVKELTGMVDTVNSKLDVQLKSFEETRKEEKLDRIHDFIEEAKIAFGIDIDFEVAIDYKWLNKGYTDKKWQKEVEDKFSQIKTDLSVINSMSVDEHDTLIAYYLRTLDLTKALNQHKEYIEMKSAVKEVVEVQEKPIVVEEVKAEEVKIEKQELVTVSFSATGTKSELQRLGDYLNDNFEEWEKL